MQAKVKEGAPYDIRLTKSVPVIWVSCPRFLWTAICPRGDRGDEGHETRNRTR